MCLLASRQAGFFTEEECAVNAMPASSKPQLPFNNVCNFAMTNDSLMEKPGTDSNGDLISASASVTRMI